MGALLAGSVRRRQQTSGSRQERRATVGRRCRVLDARADECCELAVEGAAPAPLTPGEALAKLFLDNADRGCNAENGVFVEELLTRRRAIQALANPSGE